MLVRKSLLFLPLPFLVIGETVINHFFRWHYFNFMPEFSLIWILILSLFYAERSTLLLLFISGLLKDSVSLTPLGFTSLVYLWLFAVLRQFIYRKVHKDQYFILTLVLIFSLFLKNFLLELFLLFFKIDDQSFLFFLDIRFWMTLGTTAGAGFFLLPPLIKTLDFLDRKER